MQPILNLIPSANDDVHQMGEKFVKEQTERDTRHVRILWAVLIVLAIGLIGTSWYGYRTLENHEALLGPIPSLQELGIMMDGRVSAVEQKINDWTNDQSALVDRVGKMEKALSSNVKSVRNGLQRLQGRVQNVESVQRETQDQLAADRAEIGSLKQELAKLQQQNAERLAELQQTQSNVNTQVTAVDEPDTGKTVESLQR